MLKKAVWLFLLIMVPGVMSAAPSIMSGRIVDAEHWTAGLESDVFSYSNNYSALPGVFARYGIGGGFDAGLNVSLYSAMIDLRYLFIQSGPFWVSADFEAGVAQQDLYWIGTYSVAVMMTLEVFDVLDVYLAARFRYPAISGLDSSGHTLTGAVFMPKMGIEVMQQGPLTILCEAGIAKSWAYSSSWPMTAGAAVFYQF